MWTSVCRRVESARDRLLININKPTSTVGSRATQADDTQKEMPQRKQFDSNRTSLRDYFRIIVQDRRMLKGLLGSHFFFFKTRLFGLSWAASAYNTFFQVHFPNQSAQKTSFELTHDSDKWRIIQGWKIWHDCLIKRAGRFCKSSRADGSHAESRMHRIGIGWCYDQFKSLQPFFF